MVIDIDGRRNRIASGKILLGFRDTVMLALGFFPGTLTRHHLYQLYAKVHQQLTRIKVVTFDLPPENVFYKMLQKLYRQELIKETYINQNYGMDLSIQGQAAFEVIVANLQIHPDFKRIVNIFDFYRSSAAI